MATIPDEIKKMIEEKYKLAKGTDSAAIEWNNRTEVARLAATFGYSLAEKELEAKDKEIEYLKAEFDANVDKVYTKEEYDLTESQRKEWADTTIKKQREIERLTALIEKVVHTPIRMTWQQFAKENNLL